MGKKQEFVHSLADFERPAHDGRPPPLLHRKLYPSTDAVALGQQILQVAKPLIEKTKEFANADLSTLERDIVAAADSFLQARHWIELSHSDVYRGHAAALKAAAEELLGAVRKPPKEEVWDLAERIHRKTGLPLRQEHRTIDGRLLEPVGLEALLCQVIKACKTTAMIRSRRGPRARLDLACAASDLAELWSKLSGKRFPKTLRPMPQRTWKNPTRPEFKAPGPHFVALMLPAFDPKVTFAETKTALKALAVEAE